ncbi:MAG: DUF2520 domain-containing protein [Clostridia bacterium]|nr:DUF2520 domain-containing protein [Clostridia bacterium]
MDEVGIIGLGRAGTVMAYLLAEKGYRVKVVRSKSMPGYEAQVKEHRFPVRQLEKIVREVKVLLITTPDRVIGEIVEKLVKLDLSAVKGVLHLSGNHPAAILKPLQAKGLSIGSLHPLQSLAGLEQGLLNLTGSTFTFEGDTELLPWVTALVERLECRLAIAPASFNKSLYHGGASIASNFLVVLAKMGLDCLVKAGLSPGEARQALIPLMQGTLNNLGRLPPEKALTGPIVRNDLVTINSHLEELKQLPHLLPAYQSLGQLTATLAMEAGHLEKMEYRQIVEILENGGFNNGKSDSGHLEGEKETQ